MSMRVARHWQITAVATFIIVGMTLTGLFFYAPARTVMENEIRERLSGIAAAAAMQINGDILETIRGPGDMENPEFHYLVSRLQEMRSIKNIRFVYILRATADPMVLSFVADADLALTPEELDRNGNGDGTLDPDEEPGYPGELYDISANPALQGEAFLRATSDKEVIYDQWGPLVSGYAPIMRQSTGEVNAVLGIDMEADDFLNASQEIFSPIALIFFLFMALLIGGLVIVASEHRQINLLRKINGERSGLLKLTFHQLGEPLTIMKWSLESLREDTQNPLLRKLVDDHIVCMDEGLGRLNSIIDTLQLAEKVDLDTLQYIPVESSLREVIDNAVGEWKSSLEKRGQMIVIDMKENIKLPIDRAMLSLVFRQILVNAIEYSGDNGTIDVEISHQRKHVLIAVQDHGCGIPKQDIQHLFEKYRRAGNAHLKKPDGNGLGLYIAKGIVEKAGGSIWVESIEGSGTKVSFTLPLA